MAEEMRGRFGNSELDISEYERVSEMLLNHRKEWRLQSHDLSKM